MRKSLWPLVLVLALAACGGDSPSAPIVTMPAAPAASVVTVAQNGTVQVCLSPLAAFTYRVRVPVTVRETAGLPANVNFVAIDFYNAGGQSIERRELGAALLVSGVGTNTIQGNSTNNWSINFDFNSDNFVGIRIQFNFTDQRGNVGNVTMPALTNVTSATTCG